MKSSEELAAICAAIDAVKGYSAAARRATLVQAEKLDADIKRLDEALSLMPVQDHALILRLGALEEQAEEMAVKLSSWADGTAAALQQLDDVVGLGVRRTVNPQVHALIAQLGTVRRTMPDGSVRGMSLAEIAMATGLSEGTVSKLRSGTYPVSSFPATVKRGRRAASR